MRILYYSTPAYADCDLPLVKALTDFGNEVFYVLMISPYNLHQTVIDIDEQLPANDVISARKYPCFSKFDGYLNLDRVFVQNDVTGHYSPAFFRLHRKFVKFVNDLNPDVILSSGLLRFFPSVSFIRKFKVVCIVHDPIPHSGDDILRNRFRYSRLRWYADRVILLNDTQTDKFCERFRFPKGKISIASLMPYESVTFYGSGGCAATGFVLFFGRINEYKGVSYLLDAMNSVHEKMPEARLIIAGAGEIPAGHTIPGEYVSLINRYLTNDEIADYVRSSSFVVCPYTDATQSGVIQTAFALGKPVLATEVGNFPQVIRNGINGRLVPPRDSAALSDAICELLSDSELLKKMEKNITMEKNNFYETATLYDSALKIVCHENS